MKQLRLTAIGNSLGVILPKEILALLNVDKGDALYVTRTPNGIELATYDRDFVNDMDMVDKIIRDNRNVLKKLSDS